MHHSQHCPFLVRLFQNSNKRTHVDLISLLENLIYGQQKLNIEGLLQCWGSGSNRFAWFCRIWISNIFHGSRSTSRSKPNVAHFPHPSPPPSHPPPSAHLPHPSSFIPLLSHNSSVFTHLNSAPSPLLSHLLPFLPHPSPLLPILRMQTTFVRIWILLKRFVYRFESGSGSLVKNIIILNCKFFFLSLTFYVEFVFLEFRLFFFIQNLLVI